MKEYCTVIPAYKKAFDADEKACTDGFFKTLDCDKFFFVPENLDISWYEDNYKESRFVRFPDRYFTGTKGYNKLLLNEHFYDEFSEYRYILIAQPDAALWSTRDRIPEFIAKGYDYIGAPWEPERCIWEWTFPKKKGERIKCLKKKGQGITMGNGGFCLRNVKKCKELIHEFRWRKCYWYFKRSEDIFFGVFGPDNRCGFKNADVETGRSFSREYGLRKSVTEGDIPYAVHGWSKDFRDYDEMRSFLAEHGIEI